MRWFRDAFCAEEKLIAERLGIDTYTLLEEMASRVPPGSWGVMPIFSDRMRFKNPGITLRLPLLTCPLTRINVTKRHCSVRWKKMRRLYQRVTYSKLLISRIFIPPRWFLLAEVQKGNYGVKFSLMSRDYPSIFR